MKKCRGCGLELDDSNFNQNKKTMDGYSYLCKVCSKKQNLERFALNKIIVLHKICIKCKLNKDISRFHKKTWSYDGHIETCKDCYKLKRKEIIEQNKKSKNSHIPEHKICCVCKLDKPNTDFYGKSDQRSGLSNACRQCSGKRRNSEYYKKVKRNNNYKKSYGFSIEEYNSMSDSQNNSCLICKQHHKLVVDHCHKTGKIRGLLCNNCNRAIGLLGDNVEYLQNAIGYLNAK